MYRWESFHFLENFITHFIYYDRPSKKIWTDYSSSFWKMLLSLVLLSLRCNKKKMQNWWSFSVPLLKLKSANLVVLKMLLLFESFLFTIAVFIVRGLNSILNEVNEKIKWWPVFPCELVITNLMHKVLLAILKNTLPNPYIAHPHLLKVIYFSTNLPLLLWALLFLSFKAKHQQTSSSFLLTSPPFN